MNIGRRIGSGAYGCVHLATIREVQYALKIQTKAKASAAGSINTSIENEIAILKKLDHPNIVKLHSSANYNVYSFMLLEHVDGANVSIMLAELKRFNNQRIKFVLLQLLDALEYLRSQEIVFGDLKSENVMMNKQGVVKLIDFGSARRVENGECETFLEEAKGTLDYSAPEILLSRRRLRIGEATSYEIDYWSLGCMLYEFAYRKLPFAHIRHITEDSVKKVAGAD